MNDLGSLLFIYAETSLHAGSGIALGAVDLPIQRERMSKLPMVQGSGVKGALREAFRQRWKKDEKAWKEELEHLWLTLFGHEPPGQESRTEPAELFAGALSLTDARLVLLPVRTVRGGFAWVTSPMALARLGRDWEVIQQGTAKKAPAWTGLSPTEGTALVPPKAAVVAEGSLLIEDLDYPASEDERVAGLATWLAANAFPQTAGYEPFRTRLSRQLAVLHDTDFTFLAEHATEVVTRIRIDPATGTVQDGALWSEESLPAESVLYSVAFVSDGRRRDRPPKGRNGEQGARKKYGAQDLVDVLKKQAGDGTRTRLGGDRTVGRGVVSLRLLAGGASS
ncbi:type III-B CRISPR module RAMP protein Cmr4 [Sorangium sp. So ce1024]|uniref:type III-B CRISPR module RAMP protein Cmr4 n=1 Tax=Sorangium sp. So ce1024 TaxID=3133327 RepID=UPI003EFF9964